MEEASELRRLNIKKDGKEINVPKLLLLILSRFLWVESQLAA